jgi:catechol 2,3-dioxygenase-like lactoylglutathione lyase family enzyme
VIRATGISHVGIRTADLDRFRSFYEDVIGIDVQLSFAHGPDRVAVIAVGDGTLVVFEGTGEARPDGLGIDHLGFAVPDEAALKAAAGRLVAAGASDGSIRPEGPLLAVDFVDPDGTRGEVNCLDPSFDPAHVPAGDVVEPSWFERTRRILTAPAPSSA